MKNLLPVARVALRSLHDARGDLVICQWARDPDSLRFSPPPGDAPFDVRRIFLLYPGTPDVSRGGHAHRTCHQVIVPVWGTFRVRVKTPDVPDGVEHWPGDPGVGLHVPPFTWIEIDRWAPKSAALVLCSHRFDPEDYLRDWTRYCQEVATWRAASVES